MRTRTYRPFLALAGWAAAAAFVTSSAVAAQTQPNFVVILADDLGYGDLGCYGHPNIVTPHLDQMAQEGLRFTSFYACDAVCTPSRAGLLTGRLPVRSGMWGDRIRVLTHLSTTGLPASEITLAEALRDEGYATACVGKWHLGSQTSHLPTHHGFDSWFGLPYSNDMDLVARPNPGIEPDFHWWNVPLMRDESIIERPADQTTLTERYTQEAVATINRLHDRPFFLYLAHTAPHVPLFRSSGFVDHSLRGRYGDVVEELDWSVGQILDALRQNNIEQQTLVIFTSDNGPWLTMGLDGGSAGTLRDGKGSTWEGGFRVPAIAWWPGHITPGGTCHEMASTLDLFPTLLALAGGTMPSDRVFDGYDLTPVLTGSGSSPRQEMFFYRGSHLFALRVGAQKVHWFTQPGYGGSATEHEPPLLYRIQLDPGETRPVAKYEGELPPAILDILSTHLAGLEIAPSLLD
ncbi:MAG: sulfatase [Planctomycetota bacterium]